MLEHFTKFYPYKNHPILSKIEKQLSEMEVDSNLLNIFKNNIVFLYPKTISFSFQGYPDELNNFNYLNDDVLDDSSVILRDGAAYSGITLSKDSYVNFFNSLFKAIEFLELGNLIFLIDLRDISLLDETMLLSIVKDCKDNTFVKWLFFYQDDFSTNVISNLNHILGPNNYNIICTFNEYESYIEMLLIDKSHILEFELSGRISLSSIENILRNIDFYNAIRNKYSISLDISKSKDISFFSVNILNILIHTTAHHYGITWKIVDESKTRTVLSKLTNYRALQINKHLLNCGNNKITKVNRYSNKFGVYVFDKSRRSKVLDLLDYYLSNIHSTYHEYLDEHVSVSYEHKSQSFKPKIHRQTYYNMITNIVHELVENITLHSDGIGYLSAEIIGYHFYLFIGDCGIGLKEGILNNYDLRDDVQDDRDAISQLFNLHNYRSARKEIHKFNIGAGFGLRDTLSHIFLCNGKFIYRTGSYIGSFMNPVSKISLPPKILDSFIHLDGTQYLIIIPVSHGASTTMPKGTDDFLQLAK